MKDEALEKEIEERVEKEIAKRDFIQAIEEASFDAMREGFFVAKDIIRFLTDFTVQGYIIAYGCRKEGKSIFKKSMEESWEACVEEFEQAQKNLGINEDDRDSNGKINPESMEKIVLGLLKKMISREDD